MGVKERAYQFIKYLNIPISKFEEVCGLSNGYISSMRKGFGTEKLDNVLGKFPALSRDWLLTGEGEMLKPQNDFSQLSDADLAKVGEKESYKMLMGLYKSGEIYPAAIHQKIVADKDAKIAELQKQVWELQQHLDAAKK